MKNYTWIYLLIIVDFVFLVTVSCKKDNPSDPTIPVLATTAISNITLTSVCCGGNIISDGGRPITSRGICWSKKNTPTIFDSITTDGSGSDNFTSNISSLTANTTYYLRAYATNSIGTAYGNTNILKTYTGTVTDYDGNEYYTVTIGTQIWLAENLNTTHYRNVDEIPNVITTSAWVSLNTGAYCNYDNDVNNSTIYGRLYNWYAVNDNRKIAPAGWHIPSDAEWTILINYLGGDTLAQNKLTEAGTLHWNWYNSNKNATNESGFTALPGGSRYYYIASEEFLGISVLAEWWSSTMYDFSYAWSRALDNSQHIVSRNQQHRYLGFSVRCVKD